MKFFKYILILLVVFLISGYFLLQNHSVQNKLFENTVRALFQTNEIFMNDALSVAVCGSRAPLPSPNRAETCLLVQAGTSKFIIDSGRVADNLQKWRVDYSDLEAVILSHLHLITLVIYMKFSFNLGWEAEKLHFLLLGLLEQHQQLKDLNRLLN